MKMKLYKSKSKDSLFLYFAYEEKVQIYLTYMIVENTHTHINNSYEIILNASGCCNKKGECS